MEESSEEFTLSAKPAAPPGSSGLFYTNKPQQSKKPYYRKKWSMSNELGLRCNG